ncbi:hypothetical protein U1Q18_048401, partial [Sarracenia purpurea var. burkii]
LNVPSNMQTPFLGSRITTAHLPHGRCRTKVAEVNDLRLLGLRIVVARIFLHVEELEVVGGEPTSPRRWNE